MHALPPADKLTHCLVGNALATVIVLAGGLMRAPAGVTVALAAAGVLLAALGREAYNRHQGGEWSWRDIAWTLGGLLPVGGVLVAGLLLGGAR